MMPAAPGGVGLLHRRAAQRCKRVKVRVRRRKKRPNQCAGAKTPHGNPSNVSINSSRSPQMGRRRARAAGKRALWQSASNVGRVWKSIKLRVLKPNDGKIADDT